MIQSGKYAHEHDAEYVQKVHESVVEVVLRESDVILVKYEPRIIEDGQYAVAVRQHYKGHGARVQHGRQQSHEGNVDEVEKQTHPHLVVLILVQRATVVLYDTAYFTTFPDIPIERNGLGQVRLE